MKMNLWSKVMIFYFFFFTFTSIVSKSISSTQSNQIDPQIYNFSVLNKFYRNLLEDIRQHRPIDTVFSAINTSKIRIHDYDENYLNNSCYESFSDILYAHGYNRSEVQLSKEDFHHFLPSILLAVTNPACARQTPPIKVHSILNVLIVGFCLLFVIKLIHLLTFSFVGDHCSSLTSVTLTQAFSNRIDADDEQDPSRMWRSRLWFGLAFNAFTCGLMLGTIVYHLIPNIFDIPNEDFDYIYLLRATVIFFGIYLFFIVEKLLRFRFNIDEFRFEEKIDQGNLGSRKESDSTMIQMAKMCATLHISSEMVDHSRRCTSSPLKVPLQSESDEDDDFDHDVSNDVVFKPNKNISVDEQNKRHEYSLSSRKLILYHLLNDFSNDFIYGCGLCSALFHDRLIGFILALMLFSEGFRRHSQMICQLGRQRAIFFLIISFFFLVIGFGICIYLIYLDRQKIVRLDFIQYEYIYSILYGTLLYTALVILIPELNDFGQHLQTNLQQANQTTKQRRLMKTLIIISQNLFLLIGVIISLVFACIWRYYHRIHIFEFVCSRDHFRLLCHQT